MSAHRKSFKCLACRSQVEQRLELRRVEDVVRHEDARRKQEVVAFSEQELAPARRAVCVVAGVCGVASFQHKNLVADKAPGPLVGLALLHAAVLLGFPAKVVQPVKRAHHIS